MRVEFPDGRKVWRTTAQLKGPDGESAVPEKKAAAPAVPKKSPSVPKAKKAGGGADDPFQVGMQLHFFEHPARWLPVGPLSGPAAGVPAPFRLPSHPTAVVVFCYCCCCCCGGVVVTAARAALQIAVKALKEAAVKDAGYKKKGKADATNEELIEVVVLYSKAMAKLDAAINSDAVKGTVQSALQGKLDTVTKRVGSLKEKVAELEIGADLGSAIEAAGIGAAPAAPAAPAEPAPAPAEPEPAAAADAPAAAAPAAVGNPDDFQEVTEEVRLQTSRIYFISKLAQQPLKNTHVDPPSHPRFKRGTPD